MTTDLPAVIEFAGVLCKRQKSGLWYGGAGSMRDGEGRRRHVISYELAYHRGAWSVHFWYRGPRGTCTVTAYRETLPACEAEIDAELIAAVTRHRKAYEQIDRDPTVVAGDPAWARALERWHTHYSAHAARSRVSREVHVEQEFDRDTIAYAEDM